MLGIGWLEIGVILLVAFLVLGPNSFIDTVRTAGRVIRDLRRTFNDVLAAVDLEKDETLPTHRPARPSHASEERPPPRDQT